MRLCRICCLCVLVISVRCLPVYAETYIVYPGVDSLQKAYDSAVDGDVLVLKEGTYSTTKNYFSVNKSLTITAASSNEVPTLALDIILGDQLSKAIDTTFKGIAFGGALRSASRLAVTGNSLSLVQNRFATSGGEPINTYGFDRVIMIGNRLINNAISGQYSVSATKVTVFAGNIVNRRVSLSGSPVYVVGNRFIDTTTILLGGKSYFIGNRMQTVYYSTANRPVMSVQGQSVIKNNIFQLDFGAITSVPSVLDASGGSTVIFDNNVVNVSAIAGSRSAPMIWGSGVTTAASNIFVNLPYQPFLSGNASSHYNLCYNANAAGGCGEQALLADPQFVDYIDYKLASGSPAIDAGTPSLVSFDLDGTRNDVGVYGGSFPIDQFDKQLNAEFPGPYVYPAFIGADAIHQGVLQVEAIVVNKLPNN